MVFSRSIMILHLLVILAHTWVHVPSAAPSDILWATVTQIALSRGHVYGSEARLLAVGIYCGGDGLSWDCFSAMPLWPAYGARAFHWDALGDSPWWRGTSPFRDLGLLRTGSSSASHPGGLDFLCSSSDISSSSAWAMGLIWNGSGSPIPLAPHYHCNN